jgi:2'-5' RNA ligase
MIKIGVFYIPDTTFQSEVVLLKSFFKDKAKKQKYLNHIVHSTIYVFETENKYLADVIENFVDLKKTNSKFSLEINDWIVFENDSFTKLNTLSLKINYSNKLEKLQTSVVRLLSKYSSKKEDLNLEEECLKSYKLYGFPFVGKHWTPHITIGSFDISSKEILALCDKKILFPKNMIMDNLGLYKIDQDNHTLIQKIKL